MHQRKPRRSAREIKQELRSIYTGNDGKLPDFTRLSRKKRSGMTSFLMKAIAVLSLLSVLAWGGFFLFTRGLFTGSETLRVKIETPEKIRSGEETSFTINYENAGDIPIAALSLKLNLPESFHLTGALPQPQAELEWTIGALTPKSDGTITIKGIFLSETPSIQRIQALFNYKPANFNSDFQEIESASVAINESTVGLSLTGPEKALVGDPVEYTLKIKHTGKDPVFNLRVYPVLPTDFTLEKTEPKLGEVLFWEIASLEPGKVVEIKWIGAFTSTATGELPVGARVGFMDEETFYQQSQAEVLTDVLGGAVSFHLILDGSDKDQTVSPGKVIRGSIDFKNPGTQDVEDIRFTLSLSANGKVPVDWEKAELSDAERSLDMLRWDKETTQQLEVLKAGKEGIIDFALPLVNAQAGFSDAFVVALAMNVEKVGTIISKRTIEATPIRISLASNVSLSAQARYFDEDGAPLGSGELPPKVGATTSYRILWNLTNSLHDLGNIEVSTTLPQDVVWKEMSSKDIGELSYNPVTRQVRWQMAKLPQDIKEAQAWFDVTITPKSTDAGKFMKLANQTALEATDLVTKTQTNSTLDVLTTELPGDEFAAGKGAVRQ